MMRLGGGNPLSVPESLGVILGRVLNADRIGRCEGCRVYQFYADGLRCLACGDRLGRLGGR